MASIAQDELRKLSESVKFGLGQSIKRGVVLGNNNLLGYKKDKGKLVLVKDEAVIVRNIYDLFLKNNFCYSEIARMMNKKYGKRFDSSSIKRILSNCKYKGYYCGGGNISEVDLQRVEFSKIKMEIDNSELQFYENEDGGTFKLVGKGGGIRNNDEENDLMNEINKKDAKINEFMMKIQEIDKKIEAMQKILQIDISEQEYVKELE